MSVQSVVIVQGKKYISSKIASEVWGLSQETVAKYCRKKRIQDCFQGAHRQWFISADTVKPLSDAEIHRLLFLTLQLKNDPALEIDWSTFDFDISLIDLIYSNLVFEGYIKPFEIDDKERIPYSVVLTQKGLETALPRKSGKNDMSYSNAVAQWLPIIIGAAQLLVQMAK